MNTFKNYLVVVSSTVVIFYILFNYAPQFFISEPIANMTNYQLSNSPAPEGAISFSIYNGAAIYYYEKTKLELICVLFALLISLTLLINILIKISKNKTE